jgi:hypothetical protein
MLRSGIENSASDENGLIQLGIGSFLICFIVYEQYNGETIYLIVSEPVVLLSTT